MHSLLLSLALLALPGAQQAAPTVPAVPVVAAVPAGPRESGPVRLNGIWDLNKDLSTKPNVVPADAGGRSGGGGGGRGGGMRGGGGGGSRPGAGAMNEVRALLRDLEQSAVRLTIVSRPDSVSVTDTEGVIRKFVTDGKPDKVAINGTTIDVKSKWDGDVLNQEFRAGSAKFLRSVETTTDGHQLLITITPKGDGGGVAGPAYMRFVYDRSQLQ